MASLGRSKVSHEYDPNYVFHSHSSNVPHLNSWIDELIQLTETSQPAKSTPTTDDLVQSLQRYDAVFKELLRQTSIFSEPVTKMYAKLWAGVLKLMDYMIKSYHRYVKHTSHLQTQVHNLLNEQQKREAAHKIIKEESDLERTCLRAQIRTLESELESMKLAKFGMENENQKMRRIINVYIKSSELNDPVWDVMDEDEFGLAESHKNKDNTIGKGGKKSQQIAAEDMLNMEQFGIGMRRKDSVDAGHMQLKTLNRLDIELNEILSNVLKEENRQRLLMQSLMKLIDKNKEYFFPPDEDATARNGSEVDTHTADNSESATGAAKSTVGVKHSAHKPISGKVKNLDGGATLSTAAILGNAEERDTVNVGIQVDEKDEFGVMSLEAQEEAKGRDEIALLGVAPLAPLTVEIEGAEQPYQLRRRMSSYPRVLRVPPVAWTCTTLMNIYLDKIHVDDEAAARGFKKRTLADHVYDYFVRITGLASAADVHVAQLMKACESHARKQKRITLFSSQLGLMNKEEAPPMDVRDTDFILDILRCLLKQGEMLPDFYKSMNKKQVIGKSSVLLRPDVLRITAVSTVQEIFGKWLPDGGEDYVMKVKSLPQTEKGSRYVDVDNVIDLLIEPWHTVRSNWEEHARFLFHEFCSVHRVLQEATFATDEGARASDSILVEVHKASASDCIRRPVRLFQKNDGTRDGEQGAVAGGTGGGASGAGAGSGVGAIATGNVNKEPVCEIMNRKKFVECLRTIIPNIKVQEAEEMFEEALDIAHEQVLRVLELIWMPFVDDASHYGAHHFGHQAHGHKNLGTNREYYVNMRTTLSQWTKPYNKSVFRAQDVEIDTFVAILIQKNVFPRSPLLELMNFPPKDLWTNADMFLKQLKERDRVERIGGVGNLLAAADQSNTASGSSAVIKETVVSTTMELPPVQEVPEPAPKKKVARLNSGKMRMRPPSGKPNSRQNSSRPNSSTPNSARPLSSVRKES